MAKAQGLPLSFIVIAAISVLILVLIVAFTVGGLGSSFKQLTVVGGGEELSSVQTACTAACNTAGATSSTLPAFKSSAYCTKTYSIDLTKNGQFETGETGIHCWYTSITVGTQTGVAGPAVPCTVQIGDKAYSIATNTIATACSSLT